MKLQKDALSKLTKRREDAIKRDKVFNNKNQRQRNSSKSSKDKDSLEKLIKELNKTKDTDGNGPAPYPKKHPSKGPEL